MKKQTTNKNKTFAFCSNHQARLILAIASATPITMLVISPVHLHPQTCFPSKQKVIDLIIDSNMSTENISSFHHNVSTLFHPELKI